MNRLFEYQAQLMQILGVPLEGQPNFLQNQWFLLAAIGLMSESAEVLDEMTIPTKPWKSKPIDQVEADTLEELADVFFFLMECLILAGQTANDLEDMYIEKCRKNLNRVEQSGELDQQTLDRISDLRNELDKHNVITNISVSNSQKYNDKAIQEAVPIFLVLEPIIRFKDNIMPASKKEVEAFEQQFIKDRFNDEAENYEGYDDLDTLEPGWDLE